LEIINKIQKILHLLICLNNLFSPDSFPHIEVKKCRNYKLSESKRTHGLSPIGGLARILMANFVKRNNRGEIKK